MTFGNETESNSAIFNYSYKCMKVVLLGFVLFAKVILSGQWWENFNIFSSVHIDWGHTFSVIANDVKIIWWGGFFYYNLHVTWLMMIISFVACPCSSWFLLFLLLIYFLFKMAATNDSDQWFIFAYHWILLRLGFFMNLWVTVQCTLQSRPCSR